MAQPALDSGFGAGWSCNINEGRHLGKTVGQFMCHKFFHPDSKKNLIIKYIAERKWEARLKKNKEQRIENARYAELEETRKGSSVGLERKRADGGVSFLYDAPPTFERWADQRAKRKAEIESKYLYEWQKNAPRHEFIDAVLPTEIAGSINLHQPFGLSCSKIKYPCFKCGQPGHLAFDKDCPRYAEDLTNDEKRQKGKSVFVIEVDPTRLERLVDDFNTHYDSYHETVDLDGKRMGYYKKRVELNPSCIKELQNYSEIDPTKSYKDADEKYIEDLKPMERNILFTTIRRVIRDQRRKIKIELLEAEKYAEADLLNISDDSDSDGEYELGVENVENEFTQVLDELVFGEAPVEIVIKEEPIFDYPMASMPIVNDLAAEIKTETETLSSREEQMRKRLTQRKCQQIVLKKNLEEEFNIDRDPLAEAVMVYVAEGRTQQEVKCNLLKLEEEKKRSIEARIREKQQKHLGQMKKLENTILRGIAGNEELTDETKALHAIKHRRAKGYEAIHKIQSINEQLRKLNEKIVEEENERKLEKEKKYQLVANRSQAEQKIRERLERRKDDAEKESRRREREEKRKLRKMSKKLNRLKEQEDVKTLREGGFSALSDLGRVAAKRKSVERELLDPPPTSRSKAIKVYTKSEKVKKEEVDSELEVKQELGPMKFEKEIKGKKHTIDLDFLQKFGIKID